MDLWDALDVAWSTSTIQSLSKVKLVWIPSNSNPFPAESVLPDFMQCLGFSDWLCYSKRVSPEAVYSATLCEIVKSDWLLVYVVAFRYFFHPLE